MLPGALSLVLKLNSSSVSDFAPIVAFRNGRVL